MIEYKHFAVPNAWLSNGFERSDSPYGPVVSYENVEGLEHELRLEILRQGRLLTGAQIRFLRMGLGVSQQDFAKRLGVEPQTVARWEKGETPVTPSIDQPVRMAAAKVWLPAMSVSSFPTPTQEGKPTRLVFEFRGGKWNRVEALVRIAYQETEAAEIGVFTLVDASQGREHKPTGRFPRYSARLPQKRTAHTLERHGKGLPANGERTLELVSG